MDAGVLKYEEKKKEYTDMNSLQNSLKTGNLKLAGELLGRGCDPNSLLEDEGVAPMHLAAGLCPKAVCLLVQYGGDPNVRSVDETTPVHVAAIWDQPECLQLLLDNGGDPFLRDQDGLSALDLSRNYGNADIVQLLVNYLSHDQAITPQYTIKQRKDAHSAETRDENQQDLTEDSLHLQSSVNTQPAKEPEKEEPKPTRSRLSDGKAGFGLKSSLLPSKLSRLPCGKSSLPGASKSSEKTKPAPAAVTHPAPEPQKSGLPGMRGKLPTTKLQLMRPGALQRSTIASNQTNAASSSTKKPGPMKAFVPTAKTEVKPAGMRGKLPTTKLQLMRPGALQRSTIASNQTNAASSSTKKPGPMKAFVPTAKTEVKPADPVLPTPAKVEKKVQPKNLLSSSFSTPNRSRGSSASSVDTPASSVKKRRSFLKSPTKSRLSSSGSIPSACPGRNNSVIVNSRHSSVGEAPYTPVFDGTANPRKRRPSSSSKGKVTPAKSAFENHEKAEFHASDFSATTIGDDESTSECVSSGSRVDLEPDRNPSLECQDLWAQVRADKHSRSNILNTGFCRRESRNSYMYLSDASTVDYVYLDKEHGIMLRERHIPSTCGSVGSCRSIDSPSSVQSNELPNIPETGSQKNNLDSSQDTIFNDWQEDDRQKVPDRTIDEALDESAAGDVTVVSPELLSLTDVGIRTRLRTLGDEPVTDTTRQEYLTRLSQLQADPTLKPLTKHPPEYPLELLSALAGSLNLTGVGELETKMFSAFQKPNRQCRWREGTLKTSFTYILLDPRITRNLPNRNLGDLELLNCFISAIFYIGKGTGARQYSHLYEAIKHMKKNTGVQGSSKVEHILAILAAGLGVVSLHCFHGVIPVEAYTREACMIDAVGLAKLTNMKRGDYYGVATGYPMKQRRMVGVYLLKKALQIFLLEGERQISPLDIKGDG